MNVSNVRVLCVDAGNTRVKWRVYDALTKKPLTIAGAALAADMQTQNALQSWLSTLLPTLQQSNVSQVLLCNVLGNSFKQALQLLCQNHGLSVVSIVPNKSRQLFTHYENPQQLGQDRWAACLAIAHTSQSPLNLVVSFGTATTVDAVVQEASGSNPTVPWAHLGGYIYPGVGTMFNSLSRNTAQLPVASLGQVAWPVDTHSAIASGVTRCQVDAICYIRSQLAQQYKGAVQLWLAGGYACALAGEFEAPVCVLEDAVILGLLYSAQEFKRGESL
jgi:type III pantothenate kinase